MVAVGEAKCPTKRERNESLGILRDYARKERNWAEAREKKESLKNDAYWDRRISQARNKATRIEAVIAWVESQFPDPAR